jgi:hypothetical protein
MRRKCCLINHHPVPILVVTVCVSEQLQCSSRPSRARPAETQGQISRFTRPKPELPIFLPSLTRRHATNLWAPPPGDYWRQKQFLHPSQPIISTPTEGMDARTNPAQVSFTTDLAPTSDSTRRPLFSPTHHIKVDGYIIFMITDGGATKT